jgi:hypothetical protein
MISPALSRELAALVLMTLIPSVSLAQRADEGQSAQVVLNKLVANQRAWGSKMNSAGATLELKEVSRSLSNGHTAVKYRMQASGLPADKVYSLVMWQLGAQPQENLAGVTIDGSGTAICAGRPGTCGTADKPNDPIDLVMMAGLGETKRLGLIATDKAAQAFASIVPFPNRATDGGCTLEATLVTPNAEAMLLFVTGFKPGVPLKIESTSEGEKQYSSGKTDGNGAYDWAILPFKKGLIKGRAQVSVRSDGCGPTLSFAWGTDSYILQ